MQAANIREARLQVKLPAASTLGDVLKIHEPANGANINWSVSIRKIFSNLRGS